MLPALVAAAAYVRVPNNATYQEHPCRGGGARLPGAPGGWASKEEEERVRLRDVRAAIFGEKGGVRKHRCGLCDGQPVSSVKRTGDGPGSGEQARRAYPPKP